MSSVIIALVGLALQIITTLSALQIMALMGFLVSLAIGTILVWLFEQLDQDLHSSHDESQQTHEASQDDPTS